MDEDKPTEKSVKVPMGIVITRELKDRLQSIAESEHRSLSAQAEFFLTRSVEQWNTTEHN